MQTPKTQNMLTQIENPMFKDYDGPKMADYFPDDQGVQSPQLSLEQARYMQRMNAAALRQQESYKQNANNLRESEKEKYAQNVEG